MQAKQEYELQLVSRFATFFRLIEGKLRRKCYVEAVPRLRERPLCVGRSDW